MQTSDANQCVANTVGIMFLTLIMVVYFLPTFIALMRKHHNIGAIVIVNTLLGCTCLGWIVALAWSFTSPPPPTR